MNNSFYIEVSSDLDYEKMVVYLNYQNNQVITLNCDHGFEEIEILDRFENKVIWKFDYLQFIEALNLAYQKLKEINKE